MTNRVKTLSADDMVTVSSVYGLGQILPIQKPSWPWQLLIGLLISLQRNLTSSGGLARAQLHLILFAESNR